MIKITYNQAIKQLAAYCSRAERCVQDVKTKMSRWELVPEEQEKLLQYLQKENFLDEARYCRAFVHDKSRYNAWGVYKITYKLKKKRISEALIREALQGLDTEANREQLQRILQQKSQAIKGKDAWEVRQKLIRFATGRGFALEEIDEAFIRLGCSNLP
ncbi:MAG: RecX family transcriptional regulator [Dysgonamonadaceae bacterium]|jgi:regulatory protein|nr:RecX family transcriptional regulator [Dysgonamonadaceae bacterium]